MFYAVFLLSVLSARGVLSASTFEEKLAAQLHKDLSPYLESNSIGFWFGLHNGSEHFSIPLGTRDGGITPSRSTDIVPAGSLAKPFTAVGVMQLVERGLVGLDDPIPPHIDTFLHASNGTTLEELWGPAVNNVTIRMLLNMRSCLIDYNNSQILAYTLEYPDWDLSPLDYLAFTLSRKHEFDCAPG
jgi:hypothetical protein